MVSLIIKRATVLLEFIHSSVTIKVTVISPAKPHVVTSALSVYVQVKAPHASVACACPFKDNHAAYSPVLPEPSHSTISSTASTVIVGAVLSPIIKLAVVVINLPQSSVAVKVTS